MCEIEQGMCFKILDLIVKGVSTPLAALIGAYFAYKYAVKKMHEETTIQVERSKYDRQLQALQDTWSLLSYISENENQFSIITWQKSDKGKTYSFNKKNGQEFITQLTNIFFIKGSGLYLTSDIKNSLFHVRSIVYSFLLKEKNNPDEVIPIKNEAVPYQIFIEYTKLLDLIKDRL